MTNTAACPVCGLLPSNPPPDFCARCGWELKTDITLTPSLDLPDGVVAAYEQRLAVARGVWREREAMRASLERRMEEGAERDNQLRRLEATQVELMRALEEERSENAEARAARNQAQSNAPAPESAETEAAEDDRPAITRFDTATPVPSLQRGQFETPAEFRTRINQSPPVHIGDVIFGSDYNIRRRKYPVKVVLRDWVGQTEGIHNVQSAYVAMDRETAKRIYDSGVRYPVFAFLRTEKRMIYLYAVQVITGEGPFRLKGLIVCHPEKIKFFLMTGFAGAIIGSLMVGMTDQNDIAVFAIAGGLGAFIFSFLYAVYEEWPARWIFWAVTPATFCWAILGPVAIATALAMAAGAAILIIGCLVLVGIGVGVLLESRK